MLNIGILDIQGSVIEHIKLLEKIDNIKVTRVKYLEDVENVDGLIIPGGESTTIGKLLNDFNLMEPIRNRINNGMPVWGTCAGLILLAKKIDNDDKTHIATMDIVANRNSYGSQLDSFVAKDEIISEISNKPLSLVFIRAPYIVDAGKDVEVLKVLDNKIVAARQANMFATSFHPELTDDPSVHEYFVSMVQDNQ